MFLQEVFVGLEVKFFCKGTVSAEFRSVHFIIAAVFIVLLEKLTCVVC